MSFLWNVSLHECALYFQFLMMIGVYKCFEKFKRNFHPIPASVSYLCEIPQIHVLSYLFRQTADNQKEEFQVHVTFVHVTFNIHIPYHVILFEFQLEWRL